MYYEDKIKYLYSFKFEFIMLRKLINLIIPNNSEVFFDLFIKSSNNVKYVTNLLIENISKNQLKKNLISIELKKQYDYGLTINKNIVFELNKQFVTPIDRGDIFDLSFFILKLTNNIINIHNKINKYNIVDAFLIEILIQLKEIILFFSLMLIFLKEKDVIEINSIIKKIYELEIDILNKLEIKLDKIKYLKYELLKILQLIKLTTENIVNVCNFIMKIHIKEI